ncbi:MAG TPA: hypothetical protein VFL14_05135, partial [Xanthomonadales bacterium]|nr:hypothetical protein [Xanthomonadales bacterium]
AAVAWNFRAADAEAKLDRQWQEMAYRLVATLALAGIAVAAVAVWNTASEASDWVAGRRYAFATACSIGITWAASDLAPRQLVRVVDLLAGPDRAQARYDEP